MKTDGYAWPQGAELDDHSRRKHKILREYFHRYITVRCQNPQQSKFRLAMLTGVAGVTAALFQSLSIDNTLADKVIGLHQTLETMQKDLGGTAARATNTEAQLADLAKLRADLAAAQQQIAALQSQVNELRHAPAPAQSHP